MRRIIIGWVATAICGALLIGPPPAFAQVTLVLVKEIDRIEHPSLLERLWRAADSAKARSLISQLDWSELKVPVDFIGGVAVVHFSDSGFADDSAIKAPTGYSICHAVMKDASVTCNGSITAEYRTAADPDSKKIDGLHLRVTFEKPTQTAAEPRPGRCWIYGTMIVAFVPEKKRSTFKCGETGTTAFHYENKLAKQGNK